MEYYRFQNEIAGIVSYMKQKTIRILMATAESFPTHRADVRCLFGDYLPKMGIYSDVLAISEQEVESLPLWEAGDKIILPIKGGALKRNLYSFLYFVRQLCKLPLTQYDAVQVRDMPVVASLALLFGWWRKVPVIYWMSYPIPDGQIALARERKLSSGLLKFLYPFIAGHVGKVLLYRFVLSRCRHNFVQSDVMKRDLVALGIDPDKLTPVPMGVDLAALQRFKPAPINVRNTENGIVLVYLGILERVRQIPKLFETLQLVQEKYPDTKLILAGDTPDIDYRDWLLEQVRHLGLQDSVVWTGWLDTETAWNYVLGADIALSPYPRGYLLDSASPTKVVEYMALGLPTIANDQPDQQFVLEASGAGIAVEYQPHIWAQEILNLIENKELRVGMAKAGPVWIAENRSYQGIAARVAEVYQRVLV